MSDVARESTMLVGNSFLTTVDTISGPEWRPLEALAAMVWQRPELPQFHPGEFMCMFAVRSKRQRVTIHLYKHRDTRRYLNLDDAGHTYAYVPRLSDLERRQCGGRYRRYGNVLDAIDHLELHLFETVGLFRSFPPAEWPSAPPIV